MPLHMKMCIASFYWKMNWPGNTGPVLLHTAAISRSLERGHPHLPLTKTVSCHSRHFHQLQRSVRAVPPGASGVCKLSYTWSLLPFTQYYLLSLEALWCSTKIMGLESNGLSSATFLLGDLWELPFLYLSNSVIGMVIRIKGNMWIMCFW